MGYVFSIRMANWLRKEWPLVAYPFWALVVQCWMLIILTQYEMVNVWDTVSEFLRLPRMFCRKSSLTFFLSNEFVPTDLIYIKFTTRLKIISRSAAGLDSPCGVLGRGWTTLGHCFKRQLCKLSLVYWGDIFYTFCTFMHALYIMIMYMRYHYFDICAIMS